MLLLLAACQAAPAANNAGVDRLEQKLFSHQYPKDNIDARLDRLEKMVFGESKSGSDQERIQNLLSAVPGLQTGTSDVKATAGEAGNKSSQAGMPGITAGRTTANQDMPPADSSQYPAVTAIEKQLFHKDFAGQAIGTRLERLETRVFGHVSGIDDLSERVDRLKQKTGVDIARQVPPGADWADDDDYTGAVDNRFAAGGGYTAGGAGDPMPSVSGNDGYAQGRRQPLGLNQQIGALEQEIFRKTYRHEPLPERLKRLESAVFPKEKPDPDRSLPERVERLLAAVPLSGPGTTAIAQRNSRTMNADPDDLNDLTGMTPAQVQQGGLSKIINSLGGLLSGSYAGGYPTARSGLISDPQTGLLLDPRSGSLVDPATGAVVGQAMMQANPMMNSFGSFGNGFAPFGTPYGMGYPGGMGMGFGFGGMGRYGLGGIWP